jgi:cell division protein FtsQ
VKKTSQSVLRIKKNRLQRFFLLYFREAAACVLILTAVLTMTFGFIYAYSCVLSDPAFRLRDMVVHGCREITEQEVIAGASLVPGQNLFSVSLKKVAHRIEKNPWIKEVRVGRELPDRLVMEVQERVPLALVEKEKRFRIVDRDGIVFKELDSRDNHDLPILTGCYKDGILQGDLFRKALGLLTHLSDAKESIIGYNNISELNLDEIFGLSVITNTGFCLAMGFDDYQNKLRFLPAILESLQKRNVNMRLLHIDLRDPAKITVRDGIRTAPLKTGGTGKEYRL